MVSPRLSVVLLTWNEAANIGPALDALAAQTARDFEVIVVDANSTDGTAGIVQARIPSFPVPLRLDVAATRIPVGEARNRGVALARGTSVAFLSADAIPDPRWVAQALANLARVPAVFGRQVHAPREHGLGPSVRGLRYHFPEEPRADAADLASNVNAAFRRDLLVAFPMGTSASESAVDDLLLAHRLRGAGHALGYDPAMVVRHTDVDSSRMELRKNWREGFGWGAHGDELGLHAPALAWAGLLAVSSLALAVRPGLATLGAALLVLYLPALRRAWRRRAAMPPRALLLGVLGTPPFDLTFLAAYFAGWASRLANGPKQRKPLDVRT